MKYSKEEFIKKLKSKYPNEKIKIIKYNGTSKEGIIYCSYCKKEYHYSKIGQLLNKNHKHFCPKCFLSKYFLDSIDLINTKSNLSFKKRGYNKITNKPTLIYKCNKCRTLNEKPIMEFLKYPTCIYCGKNAKRLNTQGFKLQLEEKNLDFMVLSDYQGTDNKIRLQCNKCKTKFIACPSDILNKHTSCPNCSKKTSRGEEAIIKFLNKNNIKFQKEKIFNWSKKKRYDFYLLDFNLLIEYHGIQHYKTVNNYWLSAELQKENDILKEELAKDNGYSIFSICYLDYNNIDSILIQRLSDYGVIIKDNENETI